MKHLFRVIVVVWATRLLVVSEAAAAPMLPESVAEEAGNGALEALRSRLTPLQLPPAPHQFAYQFPPATFTNKVDELEFDLATLPKIRTSPAPKLRVYIIMDYKTPSPPYLTAKTETSSATTDTSGGGFSS